MSANNACMHSPFLRLHDMTRHRFYTFFHTPVSILKIIIIIIKKLGTTFQALFHSFHSQLYMLTNRHTHTKTPALLLFPFFTLLIFFLTLIHWLCRSPSPQVTMTDSPMSRFVTILRSDHCCPMGSGLEVDMQLGVFVISGSVPCPWVSSSHT